MLKYLQKRSVRFPVNFFSTTNATFTYVVVCAKSWFTMVGNPYSNLRSFRAFAVKVNLPPRRGRIDSIEATMSWQSQRELNYIIIRQIMKQPLDPAYRYNDSSTLPQNIRNASSYKSVQNNTKILDSRMRGVNLKSFYVSRKTSQPLHLTLKTHVGSFQRIQMSTQSLNNVVYQILGYDFSK